MKKIFYVILFLFASNLVFSQQQQQIKWLTIQEAQIKMKEKPKKVLVDVYTDWCGWCKKMDASTFKDSNFVKYINENFYAIKFDAERKDSFKFMDKTYKFSPKNRSHDWAIQYMNGQMSFPTTLIFTENFAQAISIPGYRSALDFESILKFIDDNNFQKMNYEDYMTTFKSEWKK